MTYILDEIGQFAENLSFEDLPEEVVRKANDCLFDFIGCYYGALKDDNVKKAITGIANFLPSGDCHIWGTNQTSGIAEAAMAIGFAGYSLEYDDGISVSGHWGSASIPATLIGVMSQKGDGKDLVTSIVCAYETGTRISRMFSPELLKKHVHFPCSMGAFGATAGYAHALHLDKKTISGALSLAGLFPIGTYSTATSGASGKALYSGWPNYMGINAVRLAKTGLYGDIDILENKDGIAGAYSLPVRNKGQIHDATEKLGKEWRMMEVYFKPYPCCRWLHAPVYGLLKCMKNQPVHVEDICSVTVFGPEFLKMYDTHEGYESKVTCQYSIPYTVAYAICHGNLPVEAFDEQNRLDPQVLSLANKVRVKTDDVLQKQFPKKFKVHVVIEQDHKSSIQFEQDLPWSPEHPATMDELREKFRALTNDILTDEDQEEIEYIYRTGIEKTGMMERLITVFNHQTLI